jgi:hypothetical protein
VFNVSRAIPTNELGRSLRMIHRADLDLCSDTSGMPSTSHRYLSVRTNIEDRKNETNFCNHKSTKFALSCVAHQQNCFNFRNEGSSSSPHISAQRERMFLIIDSSCTTSVLASAAPFCLSTKFGTKVSPLKQFSSETRNFSYCAAVRT